MVRSHLEITKEIIKKYSVSKPVVTFNKVIIDCGTGQVIVDKYVLPEEFWSSFKETSEVTEWNGKYLGKYSKTTFTDLPEWISEIFDIISCKDCNVYSCDFQEGKRTKLLFTEYLYVIF